MANLCKDGRWNVVHYRWCGGARVADRRQRRARRLLDCVAARAQVPLEPKYMLHSTAAVQAAFRHDIDEHGCDGVDVCCCLTPTSAKCSDAFWRDATSVAPLR